MQTNEICCLIVLSPLFIVILWGAINLAIIMCSLSIVAVLRGIQDLKNTWFDAIDLVQNELRRFNH